LTGTELSMSQLSWTSRRTWVAWNRGQTSYLKGAVANQSLTTTPEG
jgi:hypothetical protein